MLKWPPPIETGRLVRRSASCSSAVEVGVATANTSIGLIWVTSLTVGMASWHGGFLSIGAARPYLLMSTRR
jgi:hypothetical protein